MDMQNVITCMEFAAAELQDAFEGMSAGELEDILVEAENLLDEARESLGLE